MVMRSSESINYQKVRQVAYPRTCLSAWHELALKVPISLHYNQRIWNHYCRRGFSLSERGNLGREILPRWPVSVTHSSVPDTGIWPSLQVPLFPSRTVTLNHPATCWDMERPTAPRRNLQSHQLLPGLLSHGWCDLLHLGTFAFELHPVIGSAKHRQTVIANTTTIIIAIIILLVFLFHHIIFILLLCYLSFVQIIKPDALTCFRASLCWML